MTDEQQDEVIALLVQTLGEISANVERLALAMKELTERVSNKYWDQQ